LKRGDLYWAELHPRSGSEQKGRRPVIICSATPRGHRRPQGRLRRSLSPNHDSGSRKAHPLHRLSIQRRSPRCRGRNPCGDRSGRMTPWTPPKCRGLTLLLCSPPLGKSGREKAGRHGFSRPPRSHSPRPRASVSAWRGLSRCHGGSGSQRSRVPSLPWSPPLSASESRIPSRRDSYPPPLRPLLSDAAHPSLCIIVTEPRSLCGIFFRCRREPARGGPIACRRGTAAKRQRTISR
jgi:hypothetical protein